MQSDHKLSERVTQSIALAAIVRQFLIRMRPEYPDGYTERQRLILAQDVTLEEMRLFTPDLARRIAG